MAQGKSYDEAAQNAAKEIAETRKKEYGWKDRDREICKQHLEAYGERKGKRRIEAELLKYYANRYSHDFADGGRKQAIATALSSMTKEVVSRDKDGNPIRDESGNLETETIPKQLSLGDVKRGLAKAAGPRAMKQIEELVDYRLNGSRYRDEARKNSIVKSATDERERITKSYAESLREANEKYEKKREMANSYSQEVVAEAKKIIDSENQRERSLRQEAFVIEQYLKWKKDKGVAWQTPEEAVIGPRRYEVMLETIERMLESDLYEDDFHEYAKGMLDYVGSLEAHRRRAADWVAEEEERLRPFGDIENTPFGAAFIEYVKKYLPDFVDWMEENEKQPNLEIGQSLQEWIIGLSERIWNGWIPAEDADEVERMFFEFFEAFLREEHSEILLAREIDKISDNGNNAKDDLLDLLFEHRKNLDRAKVDAAEFRRLRNLYLSLRQKAKGMDFEAAKAKVLKQIRTQ
jgi:hypothetical protein